TKFNKEKHSKKNSVTGSDVSVMKMNEDKPKVIFPLNIHRNKYIIQCLVEYKQKTKVKLNELFMIRFCSPDELDRIELYLNKLCKKNFEEAIMCSFDIVNIKNNISEIFNLLSSFKVSRNFAILGNSLRNNEVLILIDSKVLLTNKLPESE